MAEYKNAFTPEQPACGAEGVFGIMPTSDALSGTPFDMFQRMSAAVSSAQPSFYRASASNLSADEQELVTATYQEQAARQGKKPTKLKPLKELEELDKKMQEADKQAQDVGGIIAVVSALIKRYEIASPSVTIEYRDLTVTTDALVGSAGVPSVGNSLISLFKGLIGQKPTTVEHKILDGLSGVIRPGVATLLLGPPRSGKSSFLKVLSGRYKDGGSLRISGQLTYNGHTPNEFVIERTSAYVDQHDQHIPFLTVMETLEFAHTCQLGKHGSAFDLPAELRAAMERRRQRRQAGEEMDEGEDDPALAGFEEEHLIKLMEETYDSGVKTLGAMRNMGIAHTANTPVGDAMLRGVSGGERKRVTVAEMLVGPRRVLLLDEISTGLDSATLYSIIQLLVQVCKSFQMTMVVSLLQPPPEAYFLFNDVILMSAGHIVFHGPVPEALPFFEAQGFRCPPRKDAPSFLQEVTTASGQQELAGEELRRQHDEAQAAAAAGKGPAGGSASKWLVSPDALQAAYWASPSGQAMRNLLEQPFDKAKSHPAALVMTRFALGTFEVLPVVIRRQLLLVLRDKVLIIGRLMQVIVMGLITGSLFLQLGNTMTDSRQFFSVSFLGVMFMGMGAMPVLPITIATKGVWIKHRNNFFYPAYAQASGASLAQLPVAVVDTAVYSVILYFMVGFTYDAGYFFTYLLIMYSFAINANCMFRLIACCSPNAIVANAFGGLLLLVLILLSGFSIVRDSIPDYWIWAYYCSPFAYALRSIVINEFTSPNWSAPGPSDDGRTMGEEALESFAFFTDRRWIWAGVGFLWGTTLLFVAAAALALRFLSGEQPVAHVPDEEQLAAARAKAAERRQQLAAKTAAAEGAAAAAAQGSGKQQQELAAGASSNRSQVVVQTAPAAAVAEAVDLEEGGADGAHAGGGGGVAGLPFTPITVVWEDLKYFVPNPSAAGRGGKGGGADGADVPEKLELLKGITAYACPGTLTALMGGSGAGKTTLMDVIAGRKTVGETVGKIWINGHEKEQASWARNCGYVEQMDLHTPAQTVLEALMFSARLRLPRSTSKASVQAYVDSVVSLVELDDVMFDIVGIPGSSGGGSLNVDARKRLTLAVELVANPAVVFMDEPTSGLDARAASVVMRAIRNVGASGRTVLVTIHQPSIEIFETFDQLLLLQRGGRTTYFGPLGANSAGLVSYLEHAVPGVEPIIAGYNPATWMLEVTGAAKAVTVKAVEADWPQVYKESELCAANATHAAQLAESSRTAQPLAIESKYAAGMGTQLRCLQDKFQLVYWRTPSYNFVRLALTLVAALVYGSIYWGQGNVEGGPVGVAAVQNVMGILFSSSSFLGMMCMNSVQPLLGFERVVYYREQAAVMYSPWAYGFVLAAVEVPYLVVQAILFVGVLYPMVDFLGTAANFFYYLLLMGQNLSFYIAFGTALVYITPTQQLGQVAGAGLNFLFSLFNGFVIPYPSMPVYWQWANRLSPTTWTLYGFAADQLGGNDTPFSSPGFPEDVNTVSKFLQDFFGYDYDFRFWCLLIMVGYIFGFRCIAILALRFISFLKR